MGHVGASGVEFCRVIGGKDSNATSTAVLRVVYTRWRFSSGRSIHVSFRLHKMGISVPVTVFIAHCHRCPDAQK